MTSAIVIAGCERAVRAERQLPSPQSPPRQVDAQEIFVSLLRAMTIQIFARHRGTTFISFLYTKRRIDLQRAE
jgi:hypothetical protein